MLTLRHTVTLEPVSRFWLETAVRAVHDAVEELRSERGGLFAADKPVPNVQITAGRHIHRGTRYRIEDRDEDGTVAITHQLVVEAWGRSSATRLRYEGAGPDIKMRGEAELRSVDRPGMFRWVGILRGSGSWARYRRGRLDGRFDLRQWWTAEPDGAAPLTVEIRHPLAKAALRAGMRSAKDGRWQVTVLVTARGRGWARLPAALAAFCGGFPIRRGFRLILARMEKEWNEAVPKAVARTPQQIQADVLAWLTAD